MGRQRPKWGDGKLMEQKIEWRAIHADHVQRACELTLGGQYPARAKAKGIVIRFREQELPAKHVVKLAYCLAKGLPLGTEVNFASGDGTIKLLRQLGFEAQRRVDESAT